jgi:hypothetical protein
MSEIDVPANKFCLTDSKICGFCETILWAVDDWASSPTVFLKERNNKVHGSHRLKDVGVKAATCHLCAIFFSLFDYDEQKEFEESELKVGSEWSSGTLRKLFIGKESIPVVQDSEYNNTTSFYIG